MRRSLFDGMDHPRLTVTKLVSSTEMNGYRNDDLPKIIKSDLARQLAEHIVKSGKLVIQEEKMINYLDGVEYRGEVYVFTHNELRALIENVKMETLNTINEIRTSGGIKPEA